MLISVLQEEVRRAKAKGANYLLVCYDQWDRGRGDADLGYYYPQRMTVAEVRACLANKQLDKAGTTNSDVCEAVIDLMQVGDAFDLSLCEKPTDWLRRMDRLH